MPDIAKVLRTEIARLARKEVRAELGALKAASAAHRAEIVALRQAARLAGSPRLPGHDLYVTLEPCPMCASAIAQARIRRLYFGALDPKGGAVESGVRLFGQPTCHHAPEIYGGIAADEAATLLRQFFAQRR